MDERDQNARPDGDPDVIRPGGVRERLAVAPVRPSRSLTEPPLVSNDDESSAPSQLGRFAEAPDLGEEGDVREGVEREELETDDLIRKPFDPRKIRIVTKQPTVDLVLARIRNDEINLQPDFQRGSDIWPPRTKSRLIESLLLRIPLPVFYVAADQDDNWIVVDGLQRLGALRDFVLEETLRLRGLEYLSKFEGNRYSDLPRPMQRRINETQLSCHIIEPGTPPEVMYNIFKRINTEGRPLTGQEVRHALNPGPARDLLGELANSDEFLTATGRSVNPRRMADRECVLRFLAFRCLGVEEYAGKLDDFLLRAMKLLNQDPSRHAVLADDFRRAMSLASSVFGGEAFRKLRRPGFAQWRRPVSKPLFESLAVALAEITADRIPLLIDRKDDVVLDLVRLKEDPEFVESISIGTQTTRQVAIRFARTGELIRGILR